MSAAPVLSFEGVRIAYRMRRESVVVVADLDFSVAPGEAYGLVGESGCGKSTVAYAAMGHLGASGQMLAGAIKVEGLDIARLPASALRRLRGSRVAMVYQDPMSSLNPTMRIGRQLLEVLENHAGLTGAKARARVLEMLDDVRLPDGPSIMSRYPHQLSGGQQQRIVIAMALLAEPALVVMDEPTTGLDVTVEAAVLDLVAELRRKHGAAILFISHNLATVARVCDRVGVMYAGDIVEEGPVGEVFARPRHPYTRGLLACMPTIENAKAATRLEPIQGQVPPLAERPAGCTFAPRCPHATPGCTGGPVALEHMSATVRVRCFNAASLGPWLQPAVEHTPAAAPLGAPAALQALELQKVYTRSTVLVRQARTHALGGVSLQAHKGRTLAIVGESGCGKSTFAKVLTGLETADGGALLVDGADLSRQRVEDRPAAMTRRIQMIFQNPDATLNPSHSIGFAIGRAVARLKGLKGSARNREIERLLDTVRLPRDAATRLPRQLSGGQKQRVAIARALAGNADLLVADEPVSALDMSVQASVLNLLLDLQVGTGLTIVFISHDLAVVHHIADTVAVMYLGRVVEFGTVEAVFAPPWHPYTEALLSAAPDLKTDHRRPRIRLEGSPMSTQQQPVGCSFANRCPRKLGSICDTTPPPEQECSGHRIACHIPRESLMAMGRNSGLGQIEPARSQ